MVRAVFYNGIMRARSNSTLARPYMARLRVFSLLICPSVDAICFAFRHPADPAFDSMATKTELAGNLPDGTAPFKQSTDLIE